MAREYKGKSSTVITSRLSQRVVADYLREVHVNGRTRITAYAKHIDPGIYSLEPAKARRQLDALYNREDYEELQEMIISEERETMLRKSSLLQNKAMQLLVSTIDAAQQILDSPEVTASDVKTAASVVSSLMPALKGTTDQGGDDGGHRISPQQRRERAKGVIN